LILCDILNSPNEFKTWPGDIESSVELIYVELCENDEIDFSFGGSGMTVGRTVTCTAADSFGRGLDETSRPGVEDRTGVGALDLMLSLNLNYKISKSFGLAPRVGPNRHFLLKSFKSVPACAGS